MTQCNRCRSTLLPLLARRSNIGRALTKLLTGDGIRLSRTPTLVSVGLIGGVGGQAGLACLSSFKDQAASKFSIKSPGLDFYYLSFLQEGSVNCANRERKPSWTKERGAIFRAEPQTALHTSDGSARLSVLLPVGLVRRHAAPLFSGSNVGDLDFDAPIDGLWAIADIMTKSGAAIRPIAELVAAPFRLGAER
jgi:hypothetical protein